MVFPGGAPVQNAWSSLAEVPAKTTQSAALSEALTRAGLKFVGSTISYAFMLASGMVNDHLVSRPRYKEEQGAFGMMDYRLFGVVTGQNHC